MYLQKSTKDIKRKYIRISHERSPMDGQGKEEAQDTATQGKCS